jgi:dTDP-4-amino-4,6-dideoxygalactose transaminase
MLTTANPDYDRKFRLWRQHGMTVPDTVRHGAREVIFESYDEIGYNYRMTDLQAAVGREQLKRLPQIVEQRRALAALYTQGLAPISGIEPPSEPAWARSNWQSYCVRLRPGIDQRALMQALLDRGISTRRGVMNAHLEEAYAAEGACRLAGPLPHSEAAQQGAIMLPLFAQMTAAEVGIVVSALAEILSGRNQLVA